MARAAVGPDFDWVETEEALKESATRDAKLLERFRGTEDQAAFQKLVERHSPVVIDVCRSVMRNSADAEDAFQETFVVLVQSAAAIRQRESLRC